jgi:hypothetical protein
MAALPRAEALPRGLSMTNGKASSLLAAGGIIGGILASSCCILPLVFFGLGVSGAWIGNLTALPGTVRYSVCGPWADIAAQAAWKRSSNRIASCALAMAHSRGGIFHSRSVRFKTR